MALTISSPVATVRDTANIGPYSTASFTPTANSLLVVFMTAMATIGAGTISNSVTGLAPLTWNSIVTSSGSADRQCIWWAQVGSTAEATIISCDTPADLANGMFIKVFEITGHDTASPVAQSVMVTNNTTSADPSISLSQAMNTNNLYMAVFTNNTNPFAGAPMAGWTETDDIGFNGPLSGWHVSYRVGGETGSTVTITAISSAWKSMFVEIKIAAAIAAAKRLALLGVG